MSSDSAATPFNLAQHFLIAMPGLEDDAFARSVIYLCDYSEQGAIGLCINKPDEMLVDDLFEQVHLPLPRADLKGAPVLWGGPVQRERGFLLHPAMRDPSTQESVYASTMSLPDGLQMTTSRDILQQISEGSGPQHVLVALGYSAWGEGQLEEELGQNSWLTVPASHDILFSTPVQQRYDAALQLLGIAPGTLSSGAGRA